jgi:hypothetical protein
MALAAENAELREQLAASRDMLVETVIDGGHLHVCIEAVQAECDAWREEAEHCRRDQHGLPDTSAPGLRLTIFSTRSVGVGVSG